jgi:hypothetical protein
MHIQVETKQFNAVRDTIETLRAQGVTEWAMAGEACVALMQRDVGFAATRFLEILAIPNAEAGAVEFLARTFSNFEVLQVVRKPLEEIVTREQAYVGVGGIWVNACAAANGKLPSLASILHLSEKVRQKAAVQYLRWVAFRGEKGGFPMRMLKNLKFRMALGRLKRESNDWLQRDDEAWMEFALALKGIGARSNANAWLGEWRTRKKARVYAAVLFNLFCELGRDQEAMEMGERAVQQEERSRRHWTKLRLAWLNANDGDTKVAARWLEELEREPAVAALREFIARVVRVREASSARKVQEAQETFRQAQLTFSKKDFAQASQVVRRCMKRSAALLASSGAGGKARTWAESVTKGK